MARTQYGIIKAKNSKFPQRDLIRVQHEQGVLIATSFGPNDYKKNLAEMKKNCFHPETKAKIYFREPTTSESISVAAPDFENRANQEIFYKKWLQAGRILIMSEGIFVNLPRSLTENTEILINDGKILKRYLNGVKPIKVNKGHIYIVPDSLNLKDFGFASYETFDIGIQDNDTFVQGGLARILEHTKEKKAQNLKAITSHNNRRVNVKGFRYLEEPFLRIAGLALCRNTDNSEFLQVDSNFWVGDYRGYTFGILDSGKGNTKK